MLSGRKDHVRRFWFTGEHGLLARAILSWARWTSCSSTWSSSSSAALWMIRVPSHPAPSRYCVVRLSVNAKSVLVSSYGSAVPKGQIRNGLIASRKRWQTDPVGSGCILIDHFTHQQARYSARTNNRAETANQRDSKQMDIPSRPLSETIPCTPSRQSHSALSLQRTEIPLRHLFCTYHGADLILFGEKENDVHMGNLI